jgi:hypothetical protein
MLSLISVLGVFGVLGVCAVSSIDVRLERAKFTPFRPPRPRASSSGLRGAESPLFRQNALRPHAFRDILRFTSHMQP